MPQAKEKPKTKIEIEQTPSTKPMVGTSLPYVVTVGSRWLNRPITADIIQEEFKIPTVFSSLQGLTQFVCPGFDFGVYPLEEGNDTQTEKIKEAVARIKKVDNRIGKAGRLTKLGTIGMIRKALPELLGYRIAVFEYEYGENEGWVEPIEVQHLPSISFAKPPTQFSTNFISDNLLKGVVFDLDSSELKLFQNTGRQGANSVELNSENILYMEDTGVPIEYSFGQMLAPVVEYWKDARKNLMTGSHRISVPNEVVELDWPPKDAPTGWGYTFGALREYADALVKSQSIYNKKVTLPGMRIMYPNISMPLNPIEVDEYLERSIIALFFKRNLVEQTVQAISSTGAPIKAVLDALVRSYREATAKRWETFWSDYLTYNGFELFVQFQWWDLTPLDVEAQIKNATMIFQAGGMHINDYRKACDQSPYTDEEIELLIDQKTRLKGGGGVFGMFGGGGGEGGPVGMSRAIPKNRKTKQVKQLLEGATEEIVNILDKEGVFSKSESTKAKLQDSGLKKNWI